jgi:hypothetical protein
MPTPKLPIGSGLHRARRNRSRGPRPAPLPEFRTMRFEDHGQDFLWWTITEHGDVVGCGPFQASTWMECKVINHRALAVGVQPIFKSRWLVETKTLRYRIAAIWEGFDHMEPKKSLQVKPTPKPLRPSKIQTPKSHHPCPPTNSPTSR